jgi:cytoskeletal protein CcmA (bactofilin family)
VEVGGSIVTDQGVAAQSIEIGKRGDARGPLKAEEVIIGRDAHVESVYGKRIVLESGAHAENIYGEDITIESHCQISGEAQYTHELRLEERASLANEPRKVDRLPV